MKKGLHKPNTFFLKLIVTAVGALSIVLSSTIAQAENPPIPSPSLQSSRISNADSRDVDSPRDKLQNPSVKEIHLLRQTEEVGEEVGETEEKGGFKELSSENKTLSNQSEIIPSTPENQTTTPFSVEDSRFKNRRDAENPEKINKEESVLEGERSNTSISESEKETTQNDRVTPDVNSTVSESTPAPTEQTTNTPTSEGIKILTPTSDTVLDVPATTVILQFPVGVGLELRVNGELVDASLIGRTETDASTNLVTQTWYGVPLNQAENTITAQATDSSIAPDILKVGVRGAPKKIQLSTIETRIPADGRSTATVTGELIDARGNPSNWDTFVTLASTAGEFIGTDFKPDLAGFQVEVKKGQFTATLKSVLQAQTVRIRAGSGNLEAFTQLQFKTALRPSIATGVVDFRLGAGGTNYYGSLQDFLPPNQSNKTEFDFYSSVFATGGIGDWLFTGALNTERSLNENCNCDNSLFRTSQFNDQNYPVYGDSSKIDVLAPSIDSVYLRFERSPDIDGANPDYFMWGDYNTREFSRSSQQFTAITRQFHGFKANYNLGNFTFTGLYGNNLNAFQRDTITPDGTSGFYFLSRRLLVAGSENVFIELEELNRPGTVVQRQKLSRISDYDIDYDRGTLLFREPIFRTDVDENGEVLVKRIVVTYQHEGEGSGGNIYAGRLQYNFDRSFNQKSWLAATYLEEDQGLRDFRLYGADAKFAFGKKGKFIAEYAHSENTSETLGKVSGQAWRLEAQGQIAKGIQGRGYYRSADTGFANNATISFVPGQTRYGAQFTGQFSRNTNLRVQYDHEDNFGIAPQPLNTLEELLTPSIEAVPGSKVDNSLTTISAGIGQRFGKTTLDVDWLRRRREDRLATENSITNSDQLRSRLKVPLTDNLTFSAQNELTISSGTDSVYPDRTIFGLNWEAIKGVNVGLAQQFYTRGQFEGQSVTSLTVNGEQKLGRDTTITGRYSVLGGSNELTTQGAIGLNQNWTIAPGLRMNLGYEYVFGDLLGNNSTGVQFIQPFAVGQSAAALGIASGDSYSIGLEYTDNPNFKASARYEHRNSSFGSNTVITAGATGKVSRSLTALLRYQQASSANVQFSGLQNTGDLKLGLAYRDPNNDKFNALFRYEYRKNPSIVPENLLEDNGRGTQDHTFALEGIYAPNWQWEFYGKYAFRNSTSYLARDFTVNSTTSLAQLRATYRLGYSWDLVGEARFINQSNYTETGYVVETGYYLTPNLRLSAGYVFGRVSDRDFSGTRSGGGPYLGLTFKINDLFNGFGLQKVAPPQQQESKVKPVKETLDEETDAISQQQSQVKPVKETVEEKTDTVVKGDNDEI